MALDTLPLVAARGRPGGERARVHRRQPPSDTARVRPLDGLGGSARPLPRARRRRRGGARAPHRGSPPRRPRERRTGQLAVPPASPFVVLPPGSGLLYCLMALALTVTCARPRRCLPGLEALRPERPPCAPRSPDRAQLRAQLLPPVPSRGASTLLVVQAPVYRGRLRSAHRCRAPRRIPREPSPRLDGAARPRHGPAPATRGSPSSSADAAGSSRVAFRARARPRGAQTATLARATAGRCAPPAALSSGNAVEPKVAVLLGAGSLVERAVRPARSRPGHRQSASALDGAGEERAWSGTPGAPRRAQPNCPTARSCSTAASGCSRGHGASRAWYLLRCTWTSTASGAGRSTASGAPATSCCERWHSACAGSCATRTRSGGSGATSSSCCLGVGHAQRPRTWWPSA